MADISSVTIKNQTYNLKDKKAREWVTKVDEDTKKSLAWAKYYSEVSQVYAEGGSAPINPDNDPDHTFGVEINGAYQYCQDALNYWLQAKECAKKAEECAQKAKEYVDGIDDVSRQLDSHLADQRNPHNVTAEQVGTYDKNTIKSMLPKTVEELNDAYLYFRNDDNASINNMDTGTINVQAELVQFDSNVEVTGQLSGIVDPEDPLDAANKQYVDDKVNSVSTESLKQYVDEKIDSIPTATSSTVDTDFSNVDISSFYDTGEEESHVSPIYDKATTTWTFPYVLEDVSGYITFDLFKAGDNVSFNASTIKIEGNNDSVVAFMKINGKSTNIGSDWTAVQETILTEPIKFTAYNASIAIKMSSTSSVGVAGLMSASDKEKLDALPSKVYSTEETYNKAEIEAKLEALKSTGGLDVYSKSEVDAKLDQLVTSIVNIYGGSAEDLTNSSV